MNTRYAEWLWHNFYSDGGGGGGRKMLFLQRTFYQTEISLVKVRLIWKRQINKIHNFHFSAVKA